MKAEATNKKMSQAECSKACVSTRLPGGLSENHCLNCCRISRGSMHTYTSHTLLAFISHLSVIPWLLVLRGLQTCQNSNAPSKKNPHFHPNPYITPSFLDLPNKNKVTMKKEWPVLPLCRTVSGYPIVTHSVGPLILLFLWQDYSLWSLSPCGCTQEKGQIKEISVYPPDLSNQDVRNHWLS